MTSLLDPREVYQYLQELGYRNITPKQLQDFIKDLKKLIKYDERIQQTPKDASKENIQPNSMDNSPVFENLYVNKTAASKAKEVPKKEKVICVQIKKHKDTCRHKKAEEVYEIQDIVSSVREKLVTSAATLDSSTQRTNTSEKNIGTQDEKPLLSQRSSKQLSSTESSKQVQHVGLKPKASFIRPKSYTKIGKSDPVALYHQYQAEWKRQRGKIPGETNKNSLRWVIREKMMG